jgi:hypothetical protein
VPVELADKLPAIGVPERYRHILGGQIQHVDHVPAREMAGGEVEAALPPRRAPDGLPGGPSVRRGMELVPIPIADPERPKPAQEDPSILLRPTAILSGRQDLNLRPPGPQPGALPDCATPRDFLDSRDKPAYTYVRSKADQTFVGDQAIRLD